MLEKQKLKKETTTNIDYAEKDDSVQSPAIAKLPRLKM